MPVNAGLLNKNLTQPNALVLAYTVPSTDVAFATVSVRIFNDTNATANLRIAITMGTTPDPVDFVDEVTLQAKQAYADTCRLLSPNEKVMVHSTVGGLPIRIEGIEEPV